MIIKSVQCKNQELWVNRICCKLLHVLGTLGLKLLHGTSERDHIKDCVSLIKQTVKQLFNGTLTEITDTPTSCKNSSFSWQAGNIILQWVSVVGGGGGEGKQSKLWLQIKKKKYLISQAKNFNGRGYRGFFLARIKVGNDIVFFLNLKLQNWNIFLLNAALKFVNAAAFEMIWQCLRN